EEMTIRRRAALRYEGSDTALEVEVADGMEAAFEEAHRTRFGFASPGTPVVIETAIVEATEKSSPGFPGEGDHAEHGGGALRAEEAPPPSFGRSRSPANAGYDIRVLDRS